MDKKYYDIYLRRFINKEISTHNVGETETLIAIALARHDVEHNAVPQTREEFEKSFNDMLKDRS